MNSRTQHLDELRRGLFDVVIIGGGINGAGLIRDLALRNKSRNSAKRLAILERGHFGSGTSGRNSHLIHGGLRYLKYFDFGLVREALQERAILLETAPHMVEPLPFLMPVQNLWQALFYRAGLTLYDRLAGERNIRRHRPLPDHELRRLEPDLAANLPRASEFWDGRVESARLVLENVLDAVDNGAVAANYVEVLDWSKQQSGFSVRVRDRICNTEFTIGTQRLVNAQGAWSQASPLRLVRGSHLILPRINKSDHAVAWFEPAGRIIFFIPWGSLRQFTLVGTTDIDHTAPPEEACISAGEAAYLLDAARRVFGAANVGEPVASFSSVRPLVMEKGRSATSTSRSHRIWADSDGIVHITGGKYTTYRLMSQQAADLAVPEWAGLDPTRTSALRGNTPQAVQALRSGAEGYAKRYRVTVPEVVSYIRAYGIRLENVLSLLETEREGAAVVHAVREEFAMALTDVLCVSTTWGFERQWRRPDLIPLAALMARELGWDAVRMQEEVERTEQTLRARCGVP